MNYSRAFIEKLKCFDSQLSCCCCCCCSSLADLLLLSRARRVCVRVCVCVCTLSCAQSRPGEAQKKRGWRICLPAGAACMITQRRGCLCAGCSWGVTLSIRMTVWQQRPRLSELVSRASCMFRRATHWHKTRNFEEGLRADDFSLSNS